MLNKRRISVLVLACGMMAGATTVARADDGPGGPGGNPPQQGANDQGGPGGPGPGQQGGPGGPGGANPRRGGPAPGFHLIPRFVEEKLNLTDDQKTKMAALEKETKAKLEAILTPDQIKILATARPPGRPGGRGQGGPGAGGGQGGPGGPDGDNQRRPGGNGAPPPQN